MHPGTSAVAEVHQSGTSDVDDQTLELFGEIEHESREGRRRQLRDSVVLLNLGMARSIASRYRHRGVESDDLEQVAYVGLVKATRGFRLGAGRTFTAYARPTISGEIKRYFRDHGWMVRPPRHLQEVRAELRACEEELSHRLGRRPTEAEVAFRSRLAPDDLQAARQLSSAYHCDSLDAPVGDESATLAERVAEPGDPFEPVERWSVLTGLLRELSAFDRELLRLRYVEDLSQSEIGRVLGVSQMQVSRLLSRLLGRLREQAA
jgi:RNA polymerase sigma-B factor